MRCAAWTLPGSLGPVGDDRTVDGAVHQESRHPALDIVVLGGAPIREPIAWSGPFVMNTRAEVRAAFEDYQAGRLGIIPAQHLPHSDIHHGRDVGESAR
ncbi:MAG: pirin-like C-terminal cupin domain-containing protein [Pseudonocardiaceae bacterium]